MFISSHCNECENIDCLTRCQWIEFTNLAEARKEREKMNNRENSRVLSECMTCFACEEYCPYHSHPFDLITELQEEFNSLAIPQKILENTIERFAPYPVLKLKEIDPTKPVLNKCGLAQINSERLKGRLFDSLQYVSGKSFFCNLIYHHYARDSIIKKRALIIMQNIKEQGIKTMICFHDECYGFYASYCPRNNINLPDGFEAIHIYEYLYNYLKDHQNDIIKLNLKMAYQRSCSNRFIPDIDDWVDKICKIIGVKRVPREYDRENALCCAGIFSTLGKTQLLLETQNKNIQDMLDFGAEVVVYNCSMCLESLGSKAARKGLKNYLLSDLCRMALRDELEY